MGSKAMSKGTLRWMGLTSLIFIPFLAGSCVPTIYQPPPETQTTVFSREFDAPFDQVWAAVTYVAGSSFFDIKNFDKGSGLMTLQYSNLRGGPGPYITCGTMTGGLPLGTITPESNSVLNYIAGRLVLSGRANITVTPRGKRRTTVQINSLYDLEVDQRIGDELLLVGHWQFTSREADTHPVIIGLQTTAVTCRPSYEIERHFLTEVGARL
jgi:hypothetical protein